MNQEQINTLIEKYINGTATSEEEDMLREWYRSQANNTAEVEIGGIDEGDQIKQRILQSLREHIAAEKQVPATRQHIWKTVAIAATALLVGTLGVYLWLIKPNIIDRENINKTVQTAQDIAPGTNKATLTLADGSVIELDRAATGNLAEQGGTQIMKLDSGQLAYTTDSYGPTIAVTQYNVLATPRGGQYAITLPDGSKVWLNAASSLRFPAAFTGKERLVELAGEGYFEVAKDATKPFRVIAGGTVVEALGTAFNVNAYSDEAAVNATLVEGKVKVSKGKAVALLQPGQAAVVKEGDAISTIAADVETATAWKEGFFKLTMADLQKVMRQVARWYDVEVIFENNELEKVKFFGVLDKSQSIQEILETIKRFKIIESYEIKDQIIILK